jgi:hypothetical protein
MKIHLTQSFWLIKNHPQNIHFAPLQIIRKLKDETKLFAKEIKVFASPLLFIRDISLFFCLTNLLFFFYFPT